MDMTSFAQALAENYRILYKLPLDKFPKFPCDEAKEVIHSLKLNKSDAQSTFSMVVSLLHTYWHASLSSLGTFPICLNKDLSNTFNYRGITILSNISKILEKLLLHRISELKSPPTWTLSKEALNLGIAAHRHSFYNAGRDPGIKRARQ